MHVRTMTKCLRRAVGGEATAGRLAPLRTKTEAFRARTRPVVGVRWRRACEASIAAAASAVLELVCHSAACTALVLTPHSPCTRPSAATAAMITRFLTDVRVTFNPFSPRSKPARLFLSLIPADARASGMSVQSKLLPRTSKENATLDVKFSTCPRYKTLAAVSHV